MPESRMGRVIEFTKMHGAGNDYIYVDTDKYPIDNPEELAIKWSRFHTGIGSDGLILISRSKKADFRMRIFNSDGSEAMMCGNGSRCVGKFVYDKGLTEKKSVTLETLSGIKNPEPARGKRQSGKRERGHGKVANSDARRQHHTFCKPTDNRKRHYNEWHGSFHGQSAPCFLC